MEIIFMALLKTPEPASGFKAPDFKLKATDNNFYTLNDIKGPKGFVVAFICNHCPYVRAVIDRLVSDLSTLQDDGIGAAAIMPNDTDNYPDDSFDNMGIFAQEHNFSFPYLIDDTQEVAKSYDAICTPDIFGFNKDGHLEYRGRVDSAGPNQADAQTKRELLSAMQLIAETGTGPENQSASMGCSIKWR